MVNQLSIKNLFLVLVLLAQSSPVSATIRGLRLRSDRALKEDKKDDGGGSLLEDHSCEPDAQRAIDWVNIVGYPEQGDMDCYADPVNACSSGCCRMGTYFICDTTNFAPHLACVCNANTAARPVSTAAPVPAPTATPPPATGNDIVDTAIADGSFGTLVDLVATAGLVDALKGPGPFTVFAPMDSAFPSGAELEAFKNTTDLETLSSILLYHVVPGEIRAADLSEGATVTTLQGSDVTITLANGPMVDGANIITTDIETSNGIIHVIDAVLMPPPAGATTLPSTPNITAAPLTDIVDTAIRAGGFTTLVDLVSTAGLVETLRGEGPFTVFAPNDAAFPTGAELEAFKADTDLATLTSILTYHVVPGVIRSTDLMDGATVATVQGEMLTVSVGDDGTFEIGDVDIIAADIEASNGIIHVIDGVLMPSM